MAELSSFDHIMLLLKPKQEYMTVGRVQACRRLWASFDIERQRLTYCNIQAKLARGEPVNKVPYFAIEDNSYPPEEEESKSAPEFLRGDEPGDLVQVRYGNYYKICYREDALQFGLEITKDPWNKKPR